MHIELDWQQPIPVRSAKAGSYIYMWKPERVPEEPGIYVFARKWGKATIPIYIGRAKNLRRRTSQHMNNLRLMKGIENKEIGNRVLLLGVVTSLKGKFTEKTIKIAEQAYIEHALTAGYELLNDKGTKTPVHRINSSGKKRSHSPFPREMLIKSKSL
jgi:hypothetical protein